MVKRFRWLVLSMVGLSCALGAAEEAEKVKPKPDLVPLEIVIPNGIRNSADNQVKVLIDNLMKDSEVSGKVPVELVVISNQTGERLTYKAEVDAMNYHQKKEALFGDVRVPADTNTVRLLAVVDRDNTIEESNKDNNRRLFQITVMEPKPAAAGKEEKPAKQADIKEPDSAPAESDDTPEKGE